ncbi:gliding motility-associated lipoprotein GldH [Belliella pelovolcani]|uniref:Gliding motility-associated lipoprotein GldH n=2 Tax=Belliella pelovolcani TaxID=529505 RepID=A0A1N7L7C2_9BACT|nr:gliding motility-associated lipoprotein GldH [Belliella pelovolcani]
MTRFFYGFCLTITLSLLQACSGDRVFEAYQGMEKQSWNINDTVSFDLNPQENTIGLIAVKYNTDYAYRNLYFKYFLSDSAGNTLESQLLNIRLFDSKEGKPTGKGFGSTFTRMDTLPIESHDQYHKIEFVQYMRVDDLEGIEAIGFKQVKK